MVTRTLKLCVIEVDVHVEKKQILNIGLHVSFILILVIIRLQSVIFSIHMLP